MTPRVRLAAAALAAALLVGRAEATSLYDEEAFRPLTADRKAFRVGDVITVQVMENSSATTSSDTSTQRKNGIDASAAILNVTKPQGGTLNVGGNFSGGGTTQRSNRVLAILTVSVRELLPNGDLRVGGEQVLTINEEQHKVNVEGRVRPQDVSAENVLVSTRLADARITYAGDGELSERSRRAWWRKLIDWLGF